MLYSGFVRSLSYLYIDTRRIFLRLRGLVRQIVRFVFISQTYQFRHQTKYSLRNSFLQIVIFLYVKTCMCNNFFTGVWNSDFKSALLRFVGVNFSMEVES